MNTAQFQSEMAGEHGFVIIATPSFPIEGNFCRITTIAPTEFLTTVGDGTADLEGTTVPAGITIYGRFTSIMILNGQVIAYNSAQAPTAP